RVVAVQPGVKNELVDIGRNGPDSQRSVQHWPCISGFKIDPAGFKLGNILEVCQNLRDGTGPITCNTRTSVDASLFTGKGQIGTVQSRNRAIDTDIVIINRETEAR